MSSGVPDGSEAVAGGQLRSICTAAGWDGGGRVAEEIVGTEKVPPTLAKRGLQIWGFLLQ
jgi:hypothetical protein